MRYPGSTVLAIVPAIAALLLVTGCNAGSGSKENVTVLAAASLTEAFEAIGTEFEAEHPDISVNFSFDSSATLATQAGQGAPADVLATADPATMDSAEAAWDGQPRVFATNTMVLATPPGSALTSFGDLNRPGVTYATCVESAPCGAIAQQILRRNQVDVDPVSREVDVKGVLTKVTADEVDAGLVYATDAVSAGASVRTLPIPDADQFANEYPIVPLGQSSRPELAADFIEFVAGPTGQALLADAGFDFAP